MNQSSKYSNQSYPDNWHIRLVQSWQGPSCLLEFILITQYWFVPGTNLRIMQYPVSRKASIPKCLHNSVDDIHSLHSACKCGFCSICSICKLCEQL